MGNSDALADIIGLGMIVILIGAIIGGLFVGFPIYKVWQKEKAGLAELKQAEWNRQIQIEEAKAFKESAIYKSDAEVIRAEGVAKANKIIGDSLKDNDAYLRYLWIQGLQDGSSEVIYVPTEGQLPILEAGKRTLNSYATSVGL